MCCCFAQLLLLVLRSEYASDAQGRGVVSGVQQGSRVVEVQDYVSRAPSVLWDPRCGGAPRKAGAPPATVAGKYSCAKYFDRAGFGSSDPCALTMPEFIRESSDSTRTQNRGRDSTWPIMMATSNCRTLRPEEVQKQVPGSIVSSISLLVPVSIITGVNRQERLSKFLDT